MNHAKYLELAEKEMKDLLDTLRRKNSDYCAGEDDAFANFKVSEKLGLADAEIGLLIRMVDKIQRVRSFLSKGKLEVQTESVQDAIRDIMGYSLLLLGMLEERKPKVTVTPEIRTMYQPLGTVYDPKLHSFISESIVSNPFVELHSGEE